MLAPGTYKVWARPPGSGAPELGDEPDGYLIVAPNEGGTTSRYWIPTSQSPFPFVSDHSHTYWFHRETQPTGPVGKNIHAAVLDTPNIAPTIHEWEPWRIEVGGNLVGLAISADKSNGVYQARYAVETSVDLPIELDNSTLALLTPESGPVARKWLDDHMNNNFPSGWHEIEYEIT
jgi:hypothetical protein